MSGSNYTRLFTSNTPWYFLDFAFYHYPCTTAGGQFVPEGTCRVVIIPDFSLEYPLVLSRFCFLPLPMYHCWWTICPRGYLSGSNYTRLFTSNTPWYFLDFAFFPLPMYHCWWTICPRGYLSGSNYTRLFTSNTPWYFLDFAFYHYPCSTAGGQFVPEGTCRVVIIPDFSLRIPLGTFSILLFTTTHVPLLVDNLSPRVLVG